jgi:hypothetical protein
MAPTGVIIIIVIVIIIIMNLISEVGVKWRVCRPMAILVIHSGGGLPYLKLDPAVSTAFPSPKLKPALACQNKVKLRFVQKSQEGTTWTGAPSLTPVAPLIRETQPLAAYK